MHMCNYEKCTEIGSWFTNCNMLKIIKLHYSTFGFASWFVLFMSCKVSCNSNLNLHIWGTNWHRLKLPNNWQPTPTISTVSQWALFGVHFSCLHCSLSQISVHLDAVVVATQRKIFKGTYIFLILYKFC
jgi:hypothetical protein